MSATTCILPVTDGLIIGSIELVEFGDSLCYRSQAVRKAVCTILDQFNGQPLTYTYRHYPNPENDQSLLAALATEAAKCQGKFWPMYTALFTQPLINCATLAALALTLKLDQARFLHDLLDDHVHSLIKTDWRAGHLLGVRCPPTYLLAGDNFMVN